MSNPSEPMLEIYEEMTYIVHDAANAVDVAVFKMREDAEFYIEAEMTEKENTEELKKVLYDQEKELYDIKGTVRHLTDSGPGEVTGCR